MKILCKIIGHKHHIHYGWFDVAEFDKCLRCGSSKKERKRMDQEKYRKFTKISDVK